MVQAQQKGSGKVLEALACRVCKVALNLFTDQSDGTQEYFHSRAWLDFDHEADPVALAPADIQMACDFCPTDEAPLTVFIGDEIQHRFGRSDNTYSPGWSACRRCDQLVVEQNLDAMRDRTFEMIDVQTAASGGRLAPTLAKRDPRPLWEKFIPTIHIRQTLTSVVRLTPTRIPKARDALMRAWARPSKTPHGPELTALLAASLEMAELDWVSAEFTTLAGAAATNLDLVDLDLAPDDLPDPHGLVVWADMVAAMPDRVQGYADVIALSWTRHDDNVILVPYAQAEQVVPVPDKDLQELRSRIGWLVPVCAPIVVPFGFVEETDPWTVDLLRIVVSTWFLMAQPGVAAFTPAELDRSLVRSYTRNQRPPPVVRIVDLRRRAPRAGTSGGTFSYSVRFMVNGFWRRQAYGTGRALRRWRYITPYLKGPAGAPFKVPTDVPVVRVLR